MSQVPTSLAGLLSLLAPCFTQPSLQTFGMLVVGFVGRVRDCTVTGMLEAAGLAGEWHHSRAHDFFARRRWQPDELGVRLLDFLVSVFVSAGAPLRLAVDDTLFGRSGRQACGARTTCTTARSPKGPGGARAGATAGSSSSWSWSLTVSAVGRSGCRSCSGCSGPEDDQHPDRASQPELGRALIDMRP